MSSVFYHEEQGEEEEGEETGGGGQSAECGEEHLESGYCLLVFVQSTLNMLNIVFIN